MNRASHTFVVYHDENGNQIDEPINNRMGKSAFVKGCEIYSTDGKDVNLKAVVNQYGMTVEEVVLWHQRQPEIRNENIAVVLMWFIGLPIIVIFIAWIGFSLAGLVLGL